MPRADLIPDIDLNPEAGTDGWAVFTGCDGDAPRFIAFFLRKREAELILSAKNEDGSLVYSDCGNTSVEIAILTEHGICSANDYTITSHAQLRARIDTP